MSAPPATEATGFVDVTFTVEPNYAGWRLDRYLCEKIRRL
ncbi:MAG TPA: RluA family pseudouridine synthase, partial [Myxococcaceae bacterium]|nr:RluA family pseudouridine synthase [Myxococcaceae bacterium]